MLMLKVLVLAVGLALLGWNVAGVATDALRRSRLWRRHAAGTAAPDETAPAFPGARRLRGVAIGIATLLAGSSLVLVPSGMAGIRVSQIRGVRPGTLGTGVHFVYPLVESLALYDVRDHLLTTGADTKQGPLGVQTREGLELGLAVSVRYRLDASRLPQLHASLPADLEGRVVPTVVASVFRELAPSYMVREVFATKREEIRRLAQDAIAEKLMRDGVVVEEVLLADIVLPAKYAEGLEGLLLKQQENERLVVELEVKQKLVRQTELEAEADKAREVKAAEAQAQVRVLQAKGEADAMQHTLPLKQKQIEQSRLEAEARRAATLMNAEAAAQAKVIDGKAEVERDRMMAEAEAHRIRVTGAADSERMNLEAAVLKDNPLLIQKIVAERLSDKMQIVMVPMDGSNFFAADVFRSMASRPAPEAPDAKGPKLARR
jgi:regulator of protease activity HflC (stomatin/prohibitin superfamily)